MIKVFKRDDTAFVDSFIQWERRHPYAFSFLLSLVFVSYALFYTPSLDFRENDMSPVDTLTFVDLDMAYAPVRKVSREITTENDASADDTSNVDRAVGVADEETAVDIAFYPSIAPPRPVGRLKDYFPSSARELNIEAVANLQILISTGGKVMSVNILGIKLTKELPPEQYARIVKDFAAAARRNLVGQQFTPAVYQGKQIPVKADFTYKFVLR
ncbi:MAG: hypothetical protein CVV44_14395 [Spirochaetae bacterium HGW-Spirochaetae-1]|nr:MAG: hypothetical protein CVV44_14395 [Spirochaetae bacterium HGW-Spirochaetae-1]